MQQEKKDKLISAGSTLLIMLATIALCAWLGYQLPNPPIEEEGMGVAGEVLGEIEGFGNNDNATFDDQSAAAPAPTASDEGYTTSDEPVPIAKPKQTENKPTPAKNNESAPKSTENSQTSQTETNQTTTNPNAMFKGKKNANGGEGKGTATGSGQAGSPDGTQGAQGGNGKGNGAGYSLGGRSLRGQLPVPGDDFSKDGDVVVRIKVDRNGNVVGVEAPQKVAKNYDSQMVEAAKRAARKAHFNADASATEYQYGTITYRFRKVG